MGAPGVAERPGPVTRALQACGQRSLICYLAQSVVFVAVLAAYGGGLGDRLSVAGSAAVAAATWAAILGAAELMRRAGQRGPARGSAATADLPDRVNPDSRPARARHRSG